MRIRIWFSQEIGSTISNAGHEAKRTSRLRKRAAEFGQLFKKPALRVNSIFSRSKKACELVPELWDHDSRSEIGLRPDS